MGTNPSAGHLCQEEWLERALEVVSGEGGAKLRIATLVEAVGVTKGSFYWHFKSRDDFVRRLIDHWHERYTLTVSSRLDESQASAAEKLRKLMKMVFVEQLTRHDLAIRSWAIAEPKLRDLVKRTDDYRLDYLRQLFAGVGFDKEASELRARVFLGEAAWEAARMQRMSRSERERNAEAFFELLVAGAKAD